MSDSLVIDNVVKTFGPRRAVDGLCLRVPEGSIYGFLGPNGAGKTTTIRMIMSILYPDSGTIAVLGHSAPQAVKDRLGYLPEEKGLYKKMRVRDLVAYFGQLKGLTRADALQRATAALERFELGHVQDSRCDALSKGMGQKVQILATLIHEPEFVILDEPFSGLDPINVELVRELILDLKRQGKTVIFSTHVMEQAEQICDYLMLINNGQKLLDGSMNSIKQQAAETVHVEFDGELPALPLPGVSRVNNMGRRLELTLEAGADPQVLLELLWRSVRIRSFAIHEPTLHEIFVRTVGGTTV